MKHGFDSAPPNALQCRQGIANPVARRPRQSQLSSPQAGQRGIALVVALILLVVITLVGLAAVRGTIMQQKMTANFYDRQIAFQATEAALRQAEAAILASTAPTAFSDCSPAGGNVCLANPFDSSANTPASAIRPVAVSAFDAGKMAASQPQYVIQYMGNFKVPDADVTQLSNCSGYGTCGSLNTANFYRVTARSGPADVQDRASVTLQTMYRK
jgi:type IV pilus assembly protein PilX